MISVFFMILLISACFLAAVLNLALESRFRTLSMRVAATGAVVIGTVLYGYGYSQTLGLSLVAFLRALLAVCRMFGGINDLASIQDAPLFESPAVISIFWLGHFLAFYLTASAAIATLGARMLRNLRLKLLRRGPLTLIYGVNEDSLAYGRSHTLKNHRPLLFVSQEATLEQENEIKNMGAVLERSPEALSPSVSFLRSVGMMRKNRTIRLAALQESAGANLSYAGQLAKAMESAGISPSQANLIIRGASEQAEALQAHDGQGYGSVLAFNDYELTARLLVRENPPCNTISFDENGKAQDDYQAVIIGFGRMGEAVLSQLVRNGQFYGSHFRADIFDPLPQNGHYHGSPLLSEYDIRFHKASGKSDEFYAFLEERGTAVKTIVLCSGSPAENQEIVRELTGWYESLDTAPVILQAAKSSRLYESSILDISRIDAMAMEINQIYNADNGRTAQENWKSCDYFSRQSCRASADFYPAVLKACGRTEADVLAGSWPPEGKMLENLSITEHLRWCAFHYTCGYRTMSPEVYASRSALYRQKADASGHTSFQIRKDAARKLHACLIPWEELDGLSAREYAATGKTVDFKQADTNNILVMDKVITACRKEK